MIYRNITFKDYLALPGLNASKLKSYSISPRFGYYKEKAEFKRTMAMSIGSLVHALTLEGEEAYQDLIERNYITSGFPVNESTGKPYGETSGKYKDWIAAQDPSKEIIFPELLENTVKKVARSISEHEPSSEILKMCMNREMAVTWKCRFTGFDCKALVDFNGNIIAGDLKTFAKQLTVQSIEREMYDRQYHLQFAFYQDGLIANGFDIKEFYVIFAQNCGDYDVGCFLVNEPTMEQGQSDYIRAIGNCTGSNNLVAKFKTGLFPDLSNLGIPSYHLKGDVIDHEEQLIIKNMLEETCAK